MSSDEAVEAAAREELADIVTEQSAENWVSMGDRAAEDIADAILAAGYRKARPYPYRSQP